MNDFISISDISKKYSISNSAIHSYMSRGTVPPFIIKRMSSKGKDIFFNEKWLISTKDQLKQERKLLQINYALLKKNLSLNAIARLCIDSGANSKFTYIVKFFQDNLFDYKETSIFNNRVNNKHRELLLATYHIINVAKFICSYSEQQLHSYIASQNLAVAKQADLHSAVCPTCKEVRFVRDKIKKPTLCPACHLDKLHEMNKKEKKDLVRYYHFCRSCSTIKVSKRKLKNNLCSSCKKDKKTPLEKILMHLDGTKEVIPITTKFPKAPKRYFRFCDFCPEETAIKEVKSYKTSLGNRCPAHKHLTKQDHCNSKPKKIIHKKKSTSKAKKSKEPDPRAIERTIEKNRLHKEQQTKEKIIPSQKKTDEEMKKEWLKKNKPSTTIKKQEDFPHLPGTIHIAGGTLSSSFD